jgi:MFS family permease
MYLSHSRAADTRPDSAAQAESSPGTTTGTAGSKVPATVVALGMVSLVTDASAEMVTAILPMYLMYGLGIGYLQLGAIDGLYTGATALFRLGGGYAADRFGQPKAVATAGYGLSALTKLGLPAVGASVSGIGALMAVDRTGKGLRTAPRDALITAATPAKGLGRAFGVHRALDTCGALLGPLLAFGVLLAVPGGYDTAFLMSFCLAAVGVVILVFFVRSGGASDVRERVCGLRQCLASLNTPDIRRCTMAAGLLGLVTVGDMFFYVGIQRQMDVPVHALPLLPIGTALVFMAAAVPLGRCADRVGRWRLFLGGHLLLLGAYALLLTPLTGWLPALAILALHGLFYAATDGVLMAHVAPLVPDTARTTGLAVVQTAQALARAAGALAFGAAAALGGLGTAFTVFTFVLVAALIAASLLHKPRRPQ